MADLSERIAGDEHDEPQLLIVPDSGPFRDKVREALEDAPGGQALGITASGGTFIRSYNNAVAEVRRTGRPVQIKLKILLRRQGETSGPDDVSAELVAESVVEPEADDAFERARARGRRLASEIMAGGDMLSAEEFARRLNTTRATVNAWRQKRQVLALEGATRGFKYPEWQIGEDGRPFAVLAELFECLGGSAWAVYRFLVQHHPELDGSTGLQALRQGWSDQALEAARSVAEGFA